MTLVLILVYDLVLLFQGHDAWKAAYSKPGRKLVVEIVAKRETTQVKEHI